MTPAPTPDPNATARFTRFALDTGSADGLGLRNGALAITQPRAGTYADPFGTSRIADERGVWTSAQVPTGFVLDEVIASWNAAAPTGTWITVELRGSGGGRDTKWYTLGVWAEDEGTVHRTSVRQQDDGEGRVAFDTFVRARGAAPLTAYQLRVTLHRVAGSSATPELSLLTAIATATASATAAPFGGAARELDVPMLSQETHAGHFTEYGGGGEAWCSPTSTAMVLAFWKRGPASAELGQFPGAGHVDALVDFAARGTYDWGYRGAGNWPYNTAYAARFGLEAFVTRLASLADAERFVDAGIPLVASISGQLPGFYFTSTDGHLLVIRGFTASGDVIANDPAVPSNAQVRKVYRRADFERVWLGGSQGTVYVIHPREVPLPPVAGAPRW